MKTATFNTYHKAINHTVDYIQKHLHKPLDLKQLADVAVISEYHFHRIFKSIVGETPASFITRLRLENAAQKVRLTSLSLNEIAECTGYQSQYSLSKAFKNHFGVSPTDYKSIAPVSAVTHPHRTNTLRALKPEFISIASKKLIYTRIIAAYGDELAYRSTWVKLWKYAKHNRLLNYENEFIGLCFDDPSITSSDMCRFYACISTDEPPKPQGEFGNYFLEGGLYAVFTHQGAYSGLQNLYESIYGHWLINSSVKLRHSMPFEKYLNNPDLVNESDLLTEIYIPIHE